MTYNFTPPKTIEGLRTPVLRDSQAQSRAPGAFWETVTLSLPGDTPLAVPSDPDLWDRRSGRIVATYTRDELALTMGLALEQKRVALEARLERGLQVLEAATGCDDAEAGRLLAHWDALNAEYAVTVTTLARVNARQHEESSGRPGEAGAEVATALERELLAQTCAERGWTPEWYKQGEPGGETLSAQLERPHAPTSGAGKMSE